MYIIFGSESHARLKDNYTLLEVEGKEYQGKIIPAYAVIPAESIKLEEIPLIEDYKRLHEDFLKHLVNDEVEQCKEIASKLIGIFSGEMDSFYQHILERLESIDKP